MMLFWERGVYAAVSVVLLGWTVRGVAQDSLASVAELTRAYQNEAALQMIDTLQPPLQESVEVRYLRGRLLQRLGRLSDAAEEYDVPTQNLPPAIVLDVQERRARLLVQTQQCKEAESALQALARRRQGQSLAETLRAECAFFVESTDQAIRLLAKEVRKKENSQNAHLRVLYAKALEKKGDPKAAVRELRKMLVILPEDPFAVEAYARIQTHDEAPQFSRKERLSRARKFMRAQRYKDALAELDAAGEPEEAKDLGAWLHLRGVALYKTRERYAEAAEVLQKAAELSQGKTKQSDAFHAARALSRADKDAEAVVAYRTFLRTYPRSSYAPYAEFLAAWLEIRHQVPEGTVHMEEFLAHSKSKRVGRLRLDGLWQLAFAAYENKDWLRAAMLFERFSKEGSSGSTRGRGCYWMGRAKEQLQDTQGAGGAYLCALYAEPLHWYALWAQKRLVDLKEANLEPFATRALGTKKKPPLLPPALPDDVAFFSRLGLDQDASKALARYEKRIRNSVPRARSIEALIRAYQAVGDGAHAHRLATTKARRLLIGPSDPTTEWAWQAAYPRPYQAYVRSESQARSLPEDYLYAIMLQESRFRTHVVSHAGAVGLLQILPETAAKIARSQNEDSSRERLFDPDWNIHVGAFYSGMLLQSFGQEIVLTAAAYNAGPHRVRQWLKTSGRIELDQFVEKIPIDETRNYVRRVVTHLARYRYLRDPTHPWTVPLSLWIDPSQMSLAAKF